MMRDYGQEQRQLLTDYQELQATHQRRPLLEQIELPLLEDLCLVEVLSLIQMLV